MERDLSKGGEGVSHLDIWGEEWSRQKEWLVQRPQSRNLPVCLASVA